MKIHEIVQNLYIIKELDLFERRIKIIDDMSVV